SQIWVKWGRPAGLPFLCPNSRVPASARRTTNMPSVSLTYPPRVLYGNDILQNLGTYVAGIAKRALVVTESVMRHESYLATALDSLEARGIECIVFDSISPGATSAVLSEAAELVRASKPQVVIGFGGVRVLAAARFAAHEGSRNWPPSTSSVKYFEVPASCRNQIGRAHV